MSIKWTEEIEQVRQEQGLTARQYPDDVVLALIKIESNGDPRAHRDGSQFYGLLQMGGLAGQDAGLDSTSVLDGDGLEDIRRFFIYQERYAARHLYMPDRIALLWKAGPGTLRKVNNILAQEGLSLNAAIKKGAAGIPNAEEYIRRFRAARESYLPDTCEGFKWK